MKAVEDSASYTAVRDGEYSATTTTISVIPLPKYFPSLLSFLFGMR